MKINEKQSLFLSAKRLVLTVQAGDEHNVADLLLERVKCEIEKFEIRKRELSLKKEIDAAYASSIKGFLEEVGDE